jgi:putative phosphonate metabolism protein
MSPRYAIYYTPPPFSALARFGAGVIAYDCFDAVEVTPARLDGIDANMQKLMTLDPRRYGFHATIVAPFHLKSQSEDEFIAAASAYASRMRPVRIGPLKVAALGDFIALVPAEPNERISSFAADCLKAFDEFRAPLTAADRERRLKSGLTAHQIELLDRWGYPHVLDEYRFHMTLTGALPDNMRNSFHEAMELAFADRSRDTFELDAISVMRQDDAGSRFRVLRRCRLRG